MTTDGYTSLVSWCAEVGLVVPPVPVDLRPGLRRGQGRADRFVWTTGEVDKPALYDFDLARLIDQLVLGWGRDTVAIAHLGHGINSYFLCYVLVRGPLAVLTQHMFGGVYMDPVDTRLEIAETFLRARALVEAAPAASEAGLPRLIVASTSRSRPRPSWCHVLHDPPDPPGPSWLADAVSYDETPSALFARAHQLLASLSGGDAASGARA